MLHCGECTFLVEHHGKCGGGCLHPEKPKKPVDVAPQQRQKIESLAEIPQMIGAIIAQSLMEHEIPGRVHLPEPEEWHYEDECQYGYPDIWAARGAAALIWDEQQRSSEAQVLAYQSAMVVSQIDVSPMMTDGAAILENKVLEFDRSV